jgi:hypothetical protein
MLSTMCCPGFKIEIIVIIETQELDWSFFSMYLISVFVADVAIFIGIE